MKVYLLMLIALVLSQSVLAADFEIPALSRCLADFNDSNTKSEKVYRIHSDFYYEFTDKRDFAVRAVKEVTKAFSEKNSECQTFTQPLNRSTVKCYKIAGNDVCTLPSDAGEFVVVKDFVDSTQVVLTEYDNDYKRYPRLKSKYNYSSLWLPQPELCYDALLEPAFDSQAHKINIKDYTHYPDFRFTVARSSRDLVKKLAGQFPGCNYQTSAFSVSQMECLYRRSKSSICGLSSTGGGYFIYVSDADGEMHLLFNRWD